MGNRTKIIEASKDLIHRKGYFSTTVDEILSAAEVRKSNFYYHFKSKEELALLILDMRIEGFKEEVLNPTLNDNSLSPKTRLTQLFSRVVEYHRNLNCQRGCPFGNLATELSDINEKFRSRLNAFFHEWEHALKVCVEDGMRLGEFRSDIDPTLTACLLLSHIEGAILLVKTYKTIDPLSSGTRLILSLLGAGNNHA